jgi:H-type lectin domain
MEAYMQTGIFYFSQATDPAEWHLWSGTGQRKFRATIKFPEPFNTPPRIAVALTGVDSSNATNLRIVIAAQDVETDEFDLVVTTL